MEHDVLRIMYHFTRSPNSNFDNDPMKQFYYSLAVALVLFATPAFAQNAFTNGPESDGPSVDYSRGGAVSITHSNDTATANSGVSCAQKGTGFTTENQYLRVFILSEFSEVTGNLNVESVDVGIAPISYPASGMLETTVNLYTMAPGVDLSGGNFLYSDLTLVATEVHVNTDPDEAGVYNVPIAAPLTPSDTLVVELTHPDGTIEGNEFSIRAGGNDGGQTDFSYLASDSCSITDPTAVVNIGSFTNSMWNMVVNGTLVTANEHVAAPRTFALGQSYPNPFNPSATIPFEVNETSDVRITVFDVLGRQVTELVNQSYAPGSYTVDFNAVDLPSGTYTYRLEANGEVQVRAMSLLK